MLKWALDSSGSAQGSYGHRSACRSTYSIWHAVAKLLRSPFLLSACDQHSCACRGLISALCAAAMHAPDMSSMLVVLKYLQEAQAAGQARRLQ